jgi:hypothetical protein
LDDLVDVETGGQGDGHLLERQKKFVGPSQLVDLAHGVVGADRTSSFDERPRHLAGRVLHGNGAQRGMVRGPATTTIGHRGRVPVALPPSVSP